MRLIRTLLVHFRGWASCCRRRRRDIAASTASVQAQQVSTARDAVIGVVGRYRCCGLLRPPTGILRARRPMLRAGSKPRPNTVSSCSMNGHPESTSDPALATAIAGSRQSRPAENRHVLADAATVPETKEPIDAEARGCDPRVARPGKKKPPSSRIKVELRAPAQPI